jgi:hypothetical protein
VIDADGRVAGLVTIALVGDVLADGAGESLSERQGST